MKEELSTHDLSVIITSLEYSVKHIQDYPHQSYQIKIDSLRPLKEVMEKIRQLRRESKNK